MEFNVEKNILLDIINKSQGFIDKKTTKPILANIFIKAIDDKVNIKATDIELSLNTYIDASIKNNGSVTLPAKKLNDIIKTLPNKLIQIIVNNNYWTDIYCENTHFQILGLPDDEYPSINFDISNPVELDSDMFEYIISQVLFSAASDDTKYNLNGVYIHKINNTLRFVTTDSHRLTYYDFDYSQNIPLLNTGIIIPKRTLQEITKTLPKKDNLYIDFYENYILIRENNIIINSKLINSSFPNYNKVIPNPEEQLHQYKIKKDELTNTLKRVTAINSEITKIVKFTFKENMLKVSSKDAEYGSAEEDLPVTYNGINEEITIGFNANYILDICDNWDDGYLVFNLSNNMSPITIEPESNNKKKTIIMPMKIS